MAENEFSLDISADLSAVNSAQEMSFDTPKELINPIGDVDLPQSQSFQYESQTNLNKQGQLQFSNSIEAEPSIPLQFNQPDIEIQNGQLQYQQTVELPESQIFQSTEEKIQAQTQIQKTVISPDTKISSQDLLNKTNTLSGDLKNLTKDVESISQSLRYPDPRTDARDNFDQKITIESTNLIFFSRLARITEFPNWS
jgi:hypothetical protein